MTNKKSALFFVLFLLSVVMFVGLISEALAGELQYSTINHTDLLGYRCSNLWCTYMVSFPCNWQDAPRAFDGQTSSSWRCDVRGYKDFGVYLVAQVYPSDSPKVTRIQFSGVSVWGYGCDVGEEPCYQLVKIYGCNDGNNGCLEYKTDYNTWMPKLRIYNGFVWNPDWVEIMTLDHVWPAGDLHADPCRNRGGSPCSVTLSGQNSNYKYYTLFFEKNSKDKGDATAVAYDIHFFTDECGNLNQRCCNVGEACNSGLECIGGICQQPIKYKCNEDYQCVQDPNGPYNSQSDCQSACTPLPNTCNLTGATISTDCPTEGCDIGDIVNIEADFEGTCDLVNKIVINVKSIDSGTSLNLPAECIVESGKCVTSTSLPICYDNELFTIKNATAYRGNNYITHDDVIPSISGDIHFTNDCSVLKNVYLLPEFANIIGGDQIPLTFIAALEKAGNTHYLDVTLNPLSNYTSNNTDIISIYRRSDIVLAQSHAYGIGSAHVNGTYPLGFPNVMNDTSYFTVWPNVGCVINLASIALECGSDVLCNINEKINMSVVGRSGCPTQLQQGGDIVMRADNGAECSVEMRGSFNYNQSVPYNYDTKWLITKQNVDWKNCAGKEVIVKQVELWSKDRRLVASIYYPSGIGQFTFWSEQPIRTNKPPVAKVTAIEGTPIPGKTPWNFKCTDEVPIDGIAGWRCYDITKPLTFLQASYDPDTKTVDNYDGNITKWKWQFTGPGSSSWNPFQTKTCPDGKIPGQGSCQNGNITDTAYFTTKQSGIYRIKLNVTDDELADGESSVNQILLWDGISPVAIISDPKEGQVYPPDVDKFPPVSMLFNGSESFGAQGQPDQWNMKWQWFDGSKWILIKEGTYPTTNRTNYTIVTALPSYKVNLTIEDSNHQKSIDQVTFNLKTCSIDQTKTTIFAGRCFPGTNNYCENFNVIKDNYDCRLNGCVCSTSTPICNKDTGACEKKPTQADCNHKKTEPLCHSLAGCYWNDTNNNDCYLCGQDNRPQSCSDYNNEKACTRDPCSMDVPPALGTENCGMVIEDPPGSGQKYLIDNCHCSWSSSNGCVLNYTMTNQSNGGEQGDCEYSIDAGDCNEQNKRTVTYRLVSGTSPPCEDTRSEEQNCGLLFKPMPFFEWWNIIPVLALLVIYYVFVNKKKR